MSNIANYKELLYNALEIKPEMALPLAKELIPNVSDESIKALIESNKAIREWVYPFKTHRGAKWVNTINHEVYIIARIDPFVLTLVHLGSGKSFTKIPVNNVHDIKLGEFKWLIEGTGTTDVSKWSLVD